MKYKYLVLLFFSFINHSIHSGNHLKERDVIQFKGDIEFFRNQLPFTTNNEFDVSVLSNSQKLKFPFALWSKGFFNKSEAKGFGTLVFHVELPDISHQYFLHFERITGGCEIWINNQYHSTFGKFDTQLKASSSKGTPLVLKLPKEKNNTIAFLISNKQHHWGGGINRKPKLLKEKAVEHYLRILFVNDFTTVILILTLMLYQVYLYFLHKEKKYIYMAFICIAFILRTIVVKQSIVYDFWSTIPFSIVQKLRYGSIYLACLSILLFYREFIPKQINRKLLLFFVTVQSLGIVLCIVLNTYRVTQLAAVMRLFLLAQIVFSCWFLGLAMYKKERYSKLLIVSLCIVFVCLINNVLHASYKIHTFFIGAYLSFIYLLVQTIVNYYIQTDTNKQILRLSEELGSQKNQILALELETVRRIEEKEDLKKSLKTIEGKKSEVNKVIASIQTNAKDEQRIKTIRQAFEIDMQAFKEKLTQKHPKLTKTDIEIATLIVIGKTRKEIADLRGVQINSIKTSRNRLRKKLDLSENILLDEYLKNL